MEYFVRNMNDYHNKDAVFSNQWKKISFKDKLMILNNITDYDLKELERTKSFYQFYYDELIKGRKDYFLNKFFIENR